MRIQFRVLQAALSLAAGLTALGAAPALTGPQVVLPVHHDIWPEEGRVATEELVRRDLELMREANINFIRTSHWAGK